MLLVLLCFLAPSAQATPQLVGMVSDGRTLLWNNSDGNGAVALAYEYTTSFALYTYGPYPGWSAKALAAGYDGVPRILWTKTDGSAALWRIDANGGFTQTTYGPFPGWTAIGLAVGTNNVPRLLWSNTNGQMALWSVAADGSYTHAEYGPYAGYTATMIAIGTNNIPRILWNKNDGSISLWYSTADAANYAHTEYGPFPGYSPLSLTAGPTDSALRLLWNHPSDSTVSLWNMPTSGGYTYQYYTNPAGYVPVAANASLSGSTGLVDLLYSQSDGTALINYLGMDNASYNMETVTSTGIASAYGSTGNGSGTGTATPNPHGSYTVTYQYSSGPSTSTDGASGISNQPAVYNADYNDTAFVGTASFSNAQPGVASAHFRGTITANFVWHGDAAHPNSPAPAQVTVIQRCTAGWSASPDYTNIQGACNDYLGQQHGLGPTQFSGDSVKGILSSVKGGASFSVSCMPTADVYATGGSAGRYASATVIYTATAVVMNLAGTTLNTLNNTDTMLIGQQCTASLTGLPSAFALGGALANNVSYSWGVSGTAFHQWSQTTPQVGNNFPNLNASYYDPITGQPSVPTPNQLTLPTPQWHLNDSIATTEKITCTATLTPPSGQGSSFPLTLLSQTVNVQVPNVTEDKNFVGAGYVGPYDNGANTALYAGPTPQMVADGKKFGSTWRTIITMPAAPNYSGPGTYAYLQLITPGEYLTANNGAELPSDATQAGEGLDDIFPYYSATFTADGSETNEGDVPALKWSAGSSGDINVAAVRLRDSFKVYLMFQPPGTGSNWVPLAKSEWATYNSSVTPPDPASGLKATRPAGGRWASYSPSQSVGDVYLKQDFQPWHIHPQWTIVHPKDAVFVKQ